MFQCIIKLILLKFFDMESSFLKIYFTINYRTTMGEDLYILGNINELGNWDINAGFKLLWNNVKIILNCDFLM